MSLILEGIDLPKGETAEVIIRIQPNGSIKDGHGIFLTETKAKQIPTPHGRLIDKDELLSHLKKDPLFSLVEQYGISGVIESRPTILEAEENDEYDT